MFDGEGTGDADGADRPPLLTRRRVLGGLGGLGGAAVVGALTAYAARGGGGAVRVDGAAPGGAAGSGDGAGPGGSASDGGASDGGGALSGSDIAGITALFDARAAAVLSGDQAALLATVDPEAEPAFLLAQAELPGRIAQVPLADWSYRLVGTGAFPLPAAAASASSPDAAAPPARRLAARVELSYRLRGFDGHTVTATEYLTLVRRGGRWGVASDRDGEATGHRGDVQLWDLGTVTALRVGRRGGSALVLGLRPAAELRALAVTAAAAIRPVRRVWGERGWNGRTVVLAPATAAQFAALLGGSASAASYGSIAAVSTGELGASGAGSAPADRIIVNPGPWDGLSDLGRRVVLTHETTHAATRAITEPWTPRWLAEGAADWTAYSSLGDDSPRRYAAELAADVAAGRLPRALPTDADFASTAAGLPQAYEGAWLACRMTAARWGMARLRAFYRAVAAAQPHEESTAVADALRDVLGVSLPEFTARWRAYLADVLGGG